MEAANFEKKALYVFCQKRQFSFVKRPLRVMGRNRLLEPADYPYIRSSRHFSRVRTWLSFRNFHSSLLVKVEPVCSDATFAVVERHRDGVEDAIAVVVYIGKLHEFAAINGPVVVEKHVVVGPSYIL